MSKELSPAQNIYERDVPIPPLRGELGNAYQKSRPFLPAVAIGATALLANNVEAASEIAQQAQQGPPLNFLERSLVYGGVGSLASGTLEIIDQAIAPYSPTRYRQSWVLYYKDKNGRNSSAIVKEGTTGAVKEPVAVGGSRWNVPVIAANFLAGAFAGTNIAAAYHEGQLLKQGSAGFEQVIIGASTAVGGGAITYEVLRTKESFRRGPPTTEVSKLEKKKSLWDKLTGG